MPLRQIRTGRGYRVSIFANGYELLIGVTESQVARWALPDVGKDIAAPSWYSSTRSGARIPMGTSR